MDLRKKSNENFPSHLNEKIIRIDERLDKIWDCLLQMSDKLTEMKYILKNHIKL